MLLAVLWLRETSSHISIPDFVMNLSTFSVAMKIFFDSANSYRGNVNRLILLLMPDMNFNPVLSPRVTWAPWRS
jgi:hypothetical protein